MVCTGSMCRVTFSDAVFNRCSFVVVGGAQTTLHDPQFKDMENSMSGLSVYAHGSGSYVQLKGGAIEGGIQRVAVQAAAYLGASDLTVTGVQHVGMEVGGAGSVLMAAGGALHGFLSGYGVVDRFVDDSGDFVYHRGVHVHAQGGAQLSSVRVSTIHTVLVCTVQLLLGSMAVTHTQAHCVAVDHDGSTVHMKTSTVSHSVVRAAVHNGATMTVHGCTSALNSSGFYSCTSDCDGHGCHVAGGHVMATHVSVINSAQSGFCVGEGQAVLKSCSASSRSGPGMLFSSEDGAKSRVEDCTLAQNRLAGIVATRTAAVAVGLPQQRDLGARLCRAGGVV